MDKPKLKVVINPPNTARASTPPPRVDNRKSLTPEQVTALRAELIASGIIIPAELKAVVAA